MDGISPGYKHKALYEINPGWRWGVGKEAMLWKLLSWQKWMFTYLWKIQWDGLVKNIQGQLDLGFHDYVQKWMFWGYCHLSVSDTLIQDANSACCNMLWSLPKNSKFKMEPDTSSSRRALSHSFWPGACWVHRVMSWFILSVTALEGNRYTCFKGWWSCFYSWVAKWDHGDNSERFACVHSVWMTCLSFKISFFQIFSRCLWLVKWGKWWFEGAFLVVMPLGKINKAR